jgi:predicted aldo/keto reductase-like oxidoreductase
MEERKCREQVYVATKMLFARDREKKVFLKEGSGRRAGATEENLNEQLAKSLKRLRSDYIDILYLHSCEGPQMSTYDPMVKAFLKAKESGKARFIGISTHTNEPETIRAAVDTGIWDVILTSYNFMQEHKKEVKKAIQYATERGLGVIAMKTQGGVKLNREKKIEVNHAAALKWVLNDKNVCTAIPGITTFDQLDLDVSVIKDLSLSYQEKRDLNISSMLKGAFYCQQCRSCVSSCPRAVEIPELMRSYMYADGYGNLFQAQLTVDDLPVECGLDVCRDCVTCVATCPHGIDIRHRLGFLMAVTSIGNGAG